VSQNARVIFVQLYAPFEVLEARVGAPSQKEHGKLLEPGRLKEMLLLHHQESLHADDVVIDTSTTSPEEAAATIAAACG